MIFKAIPHNCMTILSSCIDKMSLIMYNKNLIMYKEMQSVSILQEKEET